MRANPLNLRHLSCYWQLVSSHCLCNHVVVYVGLLTKRITHALSTRAVYILLSLEGAIVKQTQHAVLATANKKTTATQGASCQIFPRSPWMERVRALLVISNQSTTMVDLSVHIFKNWNRAVDVGRELPLAIILQRKWVECWIHM